MATLETIQTDIATLNPADQALLRDYIAECLKTNNGDRAITISTFGAYNERRYGRPWAAVVVAWPGGRPELDFHAGSYLGDTTGGRLEITAGPGDVIRWGRKDGRGNGTINEWGIVAADGTITSCTPTEAKDHWRATHACGL